MKTLPIKLSEIKPKYRERFWSKVDTFQDEKRCWIWRAKTNINGYGVFWIKPHRYQAHRIAWTLIYGKIPKNKHVLHTCDNPPCVRPSHLFLGTHADNMADSARKNRCKSPRGSNHHLSKLTENDVIEIKKRLKAGESEASIARDFPVQKPAIWKIKHGYSWTWLKLERS